MNFKSAAVWLIAFIVCLGASCNAGYVNGDMGLFCKYRVKRFCDNTSEVCVQNLMTCRRYANDCQRRIENCFRKTAFPGTTVAIAMCANLPINGMGPCG